MLRSAVLARDLLHWSDGELRASGICSDLPTVQHLADVFDSAMDELDRVGAVLLEAQRRLLTAAVETAPGSPEARSPRPGAVGVRGAVAARCRFSAWFQGGSDHHLLEAWAGGYQSNSLL